MTEGNGHRPAGRQVELSPRLAPLPVDWMIAQHVAEELADPVSGQTVPHVRVVLVASTPLGRFEFMMEPQELMGLAISAADVAERSGAVRPSGIVIPPPGMRLA